jgi:hypothetical protein
VDFHEILSRVWTDLMERPSGPLAFRFLLQPTMAAALAVRDGIRDAREGNSPYFWSVVFDKGNRAAHMREGLAATGKIISLAILLDAVYQIMILKRFYPGEALIVALTLGFLPYLCLRGPVARITRLLSGR